MNYIDDLKKNKHFRATYNKVEMGKKVAAMQNNIYLGNN